MDKVTLPRAEVQSALDVLESLLEPQEIDLLVLQEAGVSRELIMSQEADLTMHREAVKALRAALEEYDTIHNTPLYTFPPTHQRLHWLTDDDVLE